MIGYQCCEILEFIDDNDELFRRFIKDQLKEDGTVSSAAFRNTKDTYDLSVDLGRLSSIEKTCRFRGLIYGVACFHAGHAIQHQQIVFHDPDYQEYDNYAHTTVKGKKSDSIRKKLARGAMVRFNPFEVVERG